MCSYRFCKSGTSLLEIIMATVVLAVAMIPIAAMIGFGHRGTSKDFRNLTAIHLLEGTMRQVLAAEYDRIPIGTLASPVDLGTFTLPLGTIASSAANYDLSLVVTGESVSFAYQPIRVDLNTFVASDAATWAFDSPVSIDFNNSSAVNPFRVKRVVGEVTWNEPEINQQRSIKMMTFLTRMHE